MNRPVTAAGGEMLTREDAHRTLARALSFPDYYGENLDALWDEVSTIKADLTLADTARMLNALDIYGCKLLQTLYEAARENPDFSFKAE